MLAMLKVLFLKVKYILYELISNDFGALFSDRAVSLQVEASGPQVVGLP